MLRQLTVGLAALTLMGQAQAFTFDTSKELPIRNIEDAAKYIDLSAAYVVERDGAPAHLLLLKNFKIDGFQMQRYGGAPNDPVKIGPDNNTSLDAVSYYFKKDALSKRVNANSFDDNLPFALAEYSCIEDKNQDIAKLDILAISPSNTDFSKPASSLTPEEAQQQLYQLSKGYRHSFTGDTRIVGIDYDDNSKFHPAAVNAADVANYYVREQQDYDGFPNDVSVNICVDVGVPGKDNASQRTADTWDFDIYKNLYIIKSDEENDGLGAMYVGWNDPSDKLAFEAGDITKKADYVMFRGWYAFHRVQNPINGAGLVHNADILIQYYHAAGIIDDAQLKAELDLYETRKAAVAPVKKETVLAECSPKVPYESFVNNKFIETIKVVAGKEAPVATATSDKMYEDVKVVFTYPDGSTVERGNPDFFATMMTDGSGKLERVYIEDLSSGDEAFSIFNIKGSDAKFFSSEDFFNRVFVTRSKHAVDCTFSE